MSNNGIKISDMTYSSLEDAVIANSMVPLASDSMSTKVNRRIPLSELKGYQGNQGTVGVTGSQGSQGSQGYQGNQGIQGYQGNQGASDIGAESYPLLVSNLNVTVTVPTNQWAYRSALIIPKKTMIARKIGLYILNTGTLTSMRMGIYSKGATDELLSQTSLITSGLTTGLNMFSITPVALTENIEYMVAIQMSADSTSLCFLSNSTISPDIPYHFARSNDNAGDPVSTMNTTISYAKSSQLIWSCVI